VSNLKMPPFDLLTAQAEPYTGFGDPLPDSTERIQKFNSVVEGARIRLKEGFALRLNDGSLIPAQLDKIIDDMWGKAWSPKEGNVNLFATDFGLLLTYAINSQLGGNIIFRSDVDVSHLSVWWPERKLEAFPFHHVLKCLLEKNTNSLESFVRGISEFR